MSNRKIRVGELLKREISDILHTRFQGRAVMITITEVDVSPDNRNAKALYSVIETRPGSERAAQRFLDENKYLICRELSRRIVLKYMPSLEFVPDQAIRHANRVNELLDSLGLETEFQSGDSGDEPSSVEDSEALLDSSETEEAETEEEANAALVKPADERRQKGGRPRRDASKLKGRAALEADDSIEDEDDRP